MDHLKVISVKFLKLNQNEDAKTAVINTSNKLHLKVILPNFTP